MDAKSADKAKGSPVLLEKQSISAAGEREAGGRFTFHRSARPRHIPQQLRALSPETEILCEWEFSGWSGAAAGRADEYVAYLESIMERQAEGFFTILEAAQVLADARSGSDPTTIMKQMLRAFHRGELAIRDPNDRIRKANTDVVREYLDLVSVSDINAWLKRDGAGYSFPALLDEVDGDDAWRSRDALLDEPAPVLPSVSIDATAVGQEQGLTRRERQIRAILDEIVSSGQDPMAVPSKGAVRNACLANRKDLFGSPSQFDEAWKDAGTGSRLKHKNHADFTRGRPLRRK
ncbi:hypothetical protein [Piscinibacter koreensis]|uniref:Uncharacterized protein n=1 Tax=Piscinibacter koreensis TaxID=2742824 RepID=A0A7Y6NP50_9BURK|nr:hypothetical protein [Schlegelella koreensis]NUZ06750.1 hypothetical protein [Schlegelella koreensis]